MQLHLMDNFVPAAAMRAGGFTTGFSPPKASLPASSLDYPAEQFLTDLLRLAGVIFAADIRPIVILVIDDEDAIVESPLGAFPAGRRHSRLRPRAPIRFINAMGINNATAHITASSF